MYSTFLVSLSECASCNNQVLKSLGTLQGVFGAEIDRSGGKVVVSHTDEVTREQIGNVLALAGYLEKESEIKYDEPSIWGCAL